MTKSVLFVWVMLFALLPGSARGCWSRPPPCGPSYRELRAEIHRLNHTYYPYERLLDRYLARAGRDESVPRLLIKRLVLLDEQVQRVTAEVLLKEQPTWRIQRQIEKVRVELCELRVELSAGLPAQSG